MMTVLMITLDSFPAFSPGGVIPPGLFSSFQQNRINIFCISFESVQKKRKLRKTRLQRSHYVSKQLLE